MLVSVQEMIGSAEKKFVLNVRAYANGQARAQKPLQFLF